MDDNRALLAVTGASGFIGRGILEGCADRGIACVALSRSTRPSWAPQAIKWSTVAYDRPADLREALTGVTHLFHLADNPSRTQARRVGETARVNSALMEAMGDCKVRRIAVASSVYARYPGSADSYGAVKRAMEEQFLSAPDLSTIILRLPPVYGPGGKGGIASLTTLVKKGMPLPFGLAGEPRSYLSRQNLVSLMLQMVNKPQQWSLASGSIFEPSDGHQLSTRDLVYHLGDALGKKPLLIPAPQNVLRLFGNLVGKADIISAAFDRLDVAPSQELEAAFGWRPVERMPESLSFLRLA